MGIRLSKKRDLTPLDPSASDFVRAVPVEVTLNIISYLTDSDLSHVCRVCKTWNTIASDEHLWRVRCQRKFRSRCMWNLKTCDNSWKKAYQKASSGDLVPQHIRRLVHFLSQTAALTTPDLFKKRVSNHDQAVIALITAMEKGQWKKVVLQDLGTSPTMTCYHEAAALLALSLERLKEPILSHATCAELLALAEPVSGDRGEVSEVQRKISTVLVEGASRSPPSGRSPATSPKATSPAASPPLSPRSSAASSASLDSSSKTATVVSTPAPAGAGAPVLVPAQLKKAASASKTRLEMTSQELEQLQHIVSSLSPPVYLQLCFLVRFFVRVCRLSDVNRTSVKKLCRLFGVIIVHGNSQDSTRLVQEAFAAPVALRLLIENFHVLFDDQR